MLQGHSAEDRHSWDSIPGSEVLELLTGAPSGGHLTWEDRGRFPKAAGTQRCSIGQEGVIMMCQARLWEGNN